jgi:pimeloyl-ACP methyl ester carboxylesterase
MAAPTPTFLTLPFKPTAPISYTFYPATSPCQTTNLLIFINGLGLPASSWSDTITLLRPATPNLNILTYDRFSQGLTTSTDPANLLPGNELGHSYSEVVSDLHALILSISSSYLSLSPPDISGEKGRLGVMMVGNSIGVPIIRLFAQTYPGLVHGAFFLDSNICNISYSEILPDLSSPGFRLHDIVSEDCSFEMYVEQRKKLGAMFDLDVENAEGLDRRTGKVLLPRSDGPLLIGKGGGVWLSVVGHDSVTFADVGFEKMGTPRSLNGFLDR